MKVNLFLVKDNYSFDTIFENEDIIKGNDFSYIVTANGGHNLPNWFKSVEENITEEDGTILKKVLKPTTSNSLLILKEFEGKKFIISFGQGYSKINDKFIVDTFGKKICMVLADKNKAKFLSVTNKEIGTKGKSSQTHIQRTGNFNDFGLIGENNYLKNIKVKISKNGNFFNGKSIVVEGGKNCKFKLGDDKTLEDVLSDAITLYAEEIQDEYLNDIYNNIKEIKKPENLIIEDIDFERIFIDHNIEHDDIVEVETVEIKYRRKKLFEIDLSDEFEVLLDKLKKCDEFDYRTTEKDKILKLNLTYKNRDGYDLKKEELINSICFEIDSEENSDNKIIYMNGKYFSISKNYLRKIDEEISSIEEFSFDNKKIPNMININTEGEFNEILANGESSYLFDKKLIHFGGNKFEFCDVLNRESKEILHVKGKGCNSISSSECEHWTNQLINGRELSFEYADTVLAKVKEMDDCDKIFKDKEEFEQFLGEATYGLISFTKNPKGLNEFPLFGKIAFYNLVRRAKQGNIKLKYYNFYKE